MSRTVGATMIVAVLLAISAAAQVQIPPRYEIVQVTENPYFEYCSKINNHGQFVFAGRLGDNTSSEEIFLYDGGELIQLTDDGVRDGFPDINDDGTIVWSRGIGPDGPYGPTLEIVMWQDGDVTRLTDDDFTDYVGGINNLGHVVWNKWIGGGCGDANSVIWSYDGNTIQQISDADWSHQGPVINDADWIAWTRYDFCQEPWWDSDIMLYVDGDTTVIDPPEAFEPQVPTINNRGQVAWEVLLENWDVGIHLWEKGEARVFTDWGMSPQLNDHGDMCFIRWYEDNSTYQAWLYLRSRFYQISDDPFWNIVGDVNNAGEVVWSSGDYPWFDIRLLRRVPASSLETHGKIDPVAVRPWFP